MSPTRKPEATRPATRKPRARPPALTALRRREIMDAAVRNFSRKGFDAACMEDIATGAKIAKGTLYLYFRSKEALYAAAVAHAVEQMQRLIEERVSVATSFRDKLSAAIATRLQFWTENGGLYRLVITIGREARHRRQTNDLLESSQAQLLAIFNEGVKSGELPKGDYAPQAWAVLDLMRGASERRMDKRSATTVDEDAAVVSAFALRAVGL